MTPAPLEGLLNYFQYLLLFGVIVPLGLLGFRTRAERRLGFLGLWVVLNGLAVATAVAAFGSGQALRNVTFWYGNQNQLYWLIASAFLLNLGLAFDADFSVAYRSLSITGLALTGYLTVGGLTLSAVLIVAIGSWLFIAWLLHRGSYSQWALSVFFVLTLLVGLVGVVFIVNHWHWIYMQGSLHVRLPQYRIALRHGIDAFPFGTGLESSEIVFRDYPNRINSSVHNFILAYFLETGLLGVLGFVLLFYAWFRGVLITAYQRIETVSPFEFSFIALFGGAVVMMLFQPVPTRRFWWFIFAISWATVLDIVDGSPINSSG